MKIIFYIFVATFGHELGRREANTFLSQNRHRRSLRRGFHSSARLESSIFNFFFREDMRENTRQFVEEDREET